MRGMTHAVLIVILSAVLTGLLAACSSSEESFGAPSAPAPAPAAAAAVQASEQAAQSPAPAPAAPVPAAAVVPKQGLGGFDLNRVQAALVQQQRVIIRTVDIELVVRDVARSVDDVAAVALSALKWLGRADRPKSKYMEDVLKAASADVAVGWAYSYTPASYPL